GFADYGERFDQNVVQRFLQRIVLLLFHPLDAVKIVFVIFRSCRCATSRRRIPVAPSQPIQPFLDALPEFVRLGAQFGVREFLHLLLISAANGKDKHKSTLPEYVLRAQTVRVVIDPNAGEPLDQPQANALARDNVEKALMEWGRFRLLLDGGESDLVIVIRTGDGRMSRPTMRGGPIDQRPGIGQSTDSDIRIG